MRAVILIFVLLVVLAMVLVPQTNKELVGVIFIAILIALIIATGGLRVRR